MVKKITFQHHHRYLHILTNLFDSENTANTPCIAKLQGLKVKPLAKIPRSILFYKRYIYIYIYIYIFIYIYIYIYIHIYTGG